MQQHIAYIFDIDVHLLCDAWVKAALIIYKEIKKMCG